MKIFACEVLQESTNHPDAEEQADDGPSINEYLIPAPDADVAAVLAMALDGGYSIDLFAPTGDGSACDWGSLVALAKSYVSTTEAR
jgi:hypothetical protein